MGGGGGGAQKQLHSEPKETIYEQEFQLKRRYKPFALQSESPINDLNDSDIQRSNVMNPYKTKSNL